MQPPEDRSGTIETLLHEERHYEPSPEFVAQANITDPDVYKRAEEDPESFWREAAKMVSWFKEPTQVLDWKPPFAKWFADGQINASYNCVDRHLDARGDKRALMPLIIPIMASIYPAPGSLLTVCGRILQTRVANGRSLRLTISRRATWG